MKTTLYIIVDVSGSMMEMGKIHLQRNLLRYAAQLKTIDPEKYEDIDIHFYQWAQEVSEIVFQSDGDVPELISEGSSNFDPLTNFIAKELKDTENYRVLILSDGNFANSDISSFQKQLNSFSCLIRRTVAVGVDADLLKLKKISSNDSVHLSENIAAAIDCAIFGIDEHVKAPESTAQILSAEPVKPEEDWDA